MELQDYKPSDPKTTIGTIDFLQAGTQKQVVPIILNTSFNDREPICENVEHSIKCFLGTNIDYLFFPEKSLLLKRRNLTGKT